MSDNIKDSSTEEEILTGFYSGENYVGEETVFTDSEVFEWEFDERAVFELFSHKVYSSDEAGLRETMFNAFAAAMRAVQKYEDIEPKVSINLYNTENEPLRLVIRDNGVGVTRETLRKAMIYVGRSQNRWISDVLGKFGVGGLAAFRLVPDNGLFVMHTHSRESEEMYRGAWTSQGFEIEKGDELPSVFDEDEYGTRFEFVLKDDITREQIQNWVQRYSHLARVSVEYEEFGFGMNNYQEYGGRMLNEEYDKLSPVLKIENEHFRAFCSPDSQGREVLLDSPIGNQVNNRHRRNFRTRNAARNGAPFSIDIRYKNENGPVIAGSEENVGKTPVSADEYEQLPDSVKDKFMLESELEETDLRLPYPTGTRETIEYPDGFWDWLGRKFYEKLYYRVDNIMEKLEKPVDYLDKLEQTERNLLNNIFVENNHRIFHRGNSRSLDGVDMREMTSVIENLTMSEPPSEGDIEKIIEQVGTDIKSPYKRLDSIVDDKFSNFFELLRTRVEIVSNESVEMGGYVRINEIVNSEFNEIYMGVSINDGRSSLVYEDNSENLVVQLPSSSADGTYSPASEMYEPLENYFNWSQLKNVTVSYAKNNMDVDEEIIETRLSNNNNPGEELLSKDVKLHYSNQTETEEMSVKELQNRIESENDDAPNEIVMFPSSHSMNITDHYHWSTRDRALFHGTKEIADLFRDNDCVLLPEEAKDEYCSYCVETSEGEMEIGNIDNFALIHVLPDDDIAKAFKQNTGKVKEEIFTKERFIKYSIDTEKDETVYIPLSREEYEKIIPSLPSNYKIVGDENTRSDINVNNSDYYLKIQLEEWSNTDMFSELRQALDDVKLSNGGKELVDALVAAQESGHKLGEGINNE